MRMGIEQIVTVFCGVVAGTTMPTTVEWQIATTTIQLTATTTTGFVS